MHSFLLGIDYDLFQKIYNSFLTGCVHIARSMGPSGDATTLLVLFTNQAALYAGDSAKK